MNTELKVVTERKLVGSDDEGYNYVTKYANDVFTVFLVEDEEEGNYVNVHSEWNHITISRYGVNVAATGSLSSRELAKHLAQLTFAHATYIEILTKLNIRGMR